MSVPNLNRISLFVQKLLGGPKISKLSQVSLSHANLGVILWSVVYIYAKFEAVISIRCKVIRGAKIAQFGHVTQATPTLGSFYGSHAGGVHRRCMYQI